MPSTSLLSVYLKTPFVANCAPTPRQIALKAVHEAVPLRARPSKPGLSALARKKRMPGQTSESHHRFVTKYMGQFLPLQTVKSRFHQPTTLARRNFDTHRPRPRHAHLRCPGHAVPSWPGSIDDSKCALPKMAMDMRCSSRIAPTQRPIRAKQRNTTLSPRRARIRTAFGASCDVWTHSRIRFVPKMAMCVT